MGRFWGLLALLLSGCAVQAPERDRGAAGGENIDRSQHLSCRNEQDSGQVDRLLGAASQKQGVILYFHGGLSSPDYMKNTLGPWLQQSIFAEPGMAEYETIFVNYDAGLAQGKNLVEMFAELAAEFTTSEAGARAIEAFRGKFKGAELIESPADVSQEAREAAISAASEQARNWLEAAYARSDYAGLIEEGSSDEQILTILSDDDVASEVGARLIEQPEFASIASDFDDYGMSLREKEGVEKGSVAWDGGKALAKALARIALGSNHQLVPTFIEEALAAFSVASLSVKDIAANHWSRVKKHAKECFAAGSPGYRLAEGLIKLKKQNTEFTVHTISHSAGSLPTGRLAQLFKKKGASIDSVQLLVPAINQKDFRKLFLANRGAIEKLRLYVLSADAEGGDRLGYKAVTVYPASLLYFVSGVADDAWYSDQLLLIAQHLKKGRRPYRWAPYRWVTRDNAKPVWKYFAKPAHQGELQYYPGDINEQDDRYKRAASHECTKYPWVSRALATEVIGNITGASTVNMPDPTSRSAMEKGLENCGGQ